MNTGAAPARKKKINKHTKKPLGKLKLKLDLAFGKMVMQRDEHLLCFSCRKVQGTQPGHFMRRGLQATRWHPWNVNTQCFRCNCVEAGNPFDYAECLNEKYGPGTSDMLRTLARTSYKPDREALEALLATAEIGPEAYQETWDFYGARL